MDLIIRQETPHDYLQVFDLVEQAFRDLKISDHKEQFLVERLRNSTAFVPELSIVAEYGNKIVGHILLTKIRIRNNRESFESLALAPVSVKPEDHCTVVELNENGLEGVNGKVEYPDAFFV